MVCFERTVLSVANLTLANFSMFMNGHFLKTKFNVTMEQNCYNNTLTKQKNRKYRSISM